MSDPQKLVWAALHEALDSPRTTSLAAWLALDTAWTAMTGPNTAVESLSHMQHMASSLQILATAPGWMKLNFPMGLSMAVMLHIQRYLISTILYAEMCEPAYQLVIDCISTFSVCEVLGLQNSNNNASKRFPAHIELATCRTSVVSPKQPVLSIFGLQITQRR